MTRRILLIDDNIDLAATLQTLLEEEGSVVSCAASLAEGRRLFIDGDFDLVILDVRLPDGNGVSLYHEFRTLRPSVKMLVITGYRLEQIMPDTCGLSVGFFPAEAVTAAEVLAARPDISVITDESLLRQVLAEIVVRGGTIAEMSDADALPASSSSDYVLIQSEDKLIGQFALAAQLRRRGVSARLLLAPVTMPQTEDTAWTGCLLKPFETETFLALVGRLLDAGEGNTDDEVAA